KPSGGRSRASRSTDCSATTSSSTRRPQKRRRGDPLDRKEQLMAADLHVTSPMMAGPDVLQIQQKLNAIGYAPGKLDGVYGAATAGAVRAFQRDNKLGVDGVGGTQTRAARRGTKKPAQPLPSVRNPS